jgi:6-pyruvoyltetrahydropterin/6-carboxytetrahydropterin synthase
MVYVTKCFHFSTAHRLYQPNLSQKENDQLFGACASDHGHNYRLEVTIRGNLDSNTGMVINLKDLKRIVNEIIVNRVDHNHLDYLSEFKGKVQTIEQMVIVFWEQLQPKLDPIVLYRLRLFETEDNFVEYYGT